MAAATFADVWRMVRLHVPDAPALLVRNWVQSAYAELTDSRPWSWTLAPGQLVWQDARDVDCTVTIGSATVTSAAQFVAGDVGRQFRVGTFPIYTVRTFTNSSQIILNETFQGADDGAVEAQIVDAYPVMPATFGAFTALVDPTLQRWVPWWCTQEELDLLDPTRQAAAANPRLLAGLSPSQETATYGQIRYQYWPIPEEAGALQYFMRKRPAELADDDVFTGVLATRPDILETGALASAARWPGTRDRPNPYFNLPLAAMLRQDFVEMQRQLDLRDDDVYQNSFDKIPWQRWTAWSWAYDTRLLQMTDASLASYFGYGAYPSWGT